MTFATWFSCTKQTAGVINRDVAAALGVTVYAVKQWSQRGGFLDKYTAGLATVLGVDVSEAARFEHQTKEQSAPRVTLRSRVLEMLDASNGTASTAAIVAAIGCSTSTVEVTRRNWKGSVDAVLSPVVKCTDCDDCTWDVAECAALEALGLPLPCQFVDAVDLALAEELDLLALIMGRYEKC